MRIFLVILITFSFWVTVFAEEIGAVSTAWKLIGPDHKIVVEAFDDEEVLGVACYVALPRKGGIKGAVGLAEDTSDISLSCRQVGPIVLPSQVVSGGSDGKQVFKKKSSLFFKKARVARFYDKKRNVLVYMSYSKKVLDGSPKNSISVVPVMEWK